jgi:poly(3-hydroxybutyrate) depolymerase
LDAGSGGAGSGGTSGGIDAGTTMSSGCGKTPTLLKSVAPPNAKITYNKVTSAGLDRQDILWYPDNYDKNRPYRLILNYHWYTGSASQVFDCTTEGINCYTTQSSFFGLLNLADNSTIFVAPDGIDAGWANTNDRDTTLTDDILKAVEADLCIDTTRVFAQGFSYGGAMSATLGCQRADVFRGVVVFAGGISGMSGACTGTTPIAYYGASGTQDSGYSGGQTAVNHFVEVNGCTAQTLPAPPTGGHSCISFQGCSVGHPVRWCPFDDIHTPSPKDKGASTTWQPKEVWTFLTQF